MHIILNNPTFNLQASPPSMAGALFSALLRDEPDTPTPAAAPIAAGRPAIGEYWPGQGGIFAGDFRGNDGSIYGLIVADCGDAKDIGKATWGPDGERDLSDWDGLANTKALMENCPAAKLAAGYTHDEHSDFYLPARRELLLGAANLHDSFGKKNWYWSSTPYSGSYAWAVDFELGDTLYDHRDSEFRVRPFRRFIY